MKKVLSLILIGAMILCLSSCGRETNNTTNSAEKKDERYVAYKSDKKTNDLVTVEEVVLIPKYYSDDDYCCGWKMKVRNTSGKDLLMKESAIRVWYSYLDENGDKMHNGYGSEGYHETIKNGEAVWIDETGILSGWTKEDTDTMKTIKIYGYGIELHGSPDYEFEEPIMIDIHDFVEF